MKNFILIIIFSLFASSVFGQSQKKYDVDKLKLGTSSAHDTELDLSGSVIKKNKTTNKIQFSNDGTIWKNLGSGSGSGSGGVSSLENGSFEDGQGSWTNTGGTFSILEYTNPSESNSKYARFVATSAGQYFESPLTSYSDDITGACLAYIGKYNTSDNNAFDFRLLDSSGNQIDSKTLATTNGTWSGGDISNGLITFPCPSAGTQYRLRVISLAAGTILSDLFYNGSENRLIEIKDQITDVIDYGATPTPTATTTAPTKGTVVYDNHYCGDIGPYTFCEYRYQQSVAGTHGAGAYISSLPSGRSFDSSVQTITALASVTYNPSIHKAVVGTCSFDVSGGGTGAISGLLFAVSSTQFQCSNWYNIASTALHGATYGGYGNASMGFNYRLFFRRSGAPTTQKALSQSQSEWMIDANIGGANVAIGASNVSSYTEITNGSLDLVVNSGSAPAKIPCTGTNATQGLNCNTGPVNESLGVVFSPPYAGWFKACFDFTHYVNGSSQSVFTAFQLVETTNSTQTIIQEGKVRKVSGANVTGSIGAINPVGLCGNFYFSDTSEKTIRLMFEQTVAGSVSTNQIDADRSSSVGQRDIHVSVIPLKNGITPMKMGDTLTTPNAENPTLCSANISATGVISNHDGGCFSSCTNATTPVCNFVSGYYPSGYIPKCWTDTASYLGDINGDSLTSSSYSGAIRNSAGTAVSGARIYFCHGRRK